MFYFKNDSNHSDNINYKSNFSQFNDLIFHVLVSFFQNLESFSNLPIIGTKE